MRALKLRAEHFCRTVLDKRIADGGLLFPDKPAKIFLRGPIRRSSKENTGCKDALRPQDTPTALEGRRFLRVSSLDEEILSEFAKNIQSQCP